MPIPGFAAIVLGAVTTGVTTLLQRNSARIAANREHRASELKRAEHIFSSISVSMDTLAFLSTEAMYGLVFRFPTEAYTPEDQKIWGAYSDALAKWKKYKTKNIAEMRRYFGSDAEDLLEEIQRDFSTLEQQLAATHFKRPKSRYFLVDKPGDKNDFRKKYFNIRGPLDGKLTKLCEDMLEMIQREHVGMLQQV